MNALIITCLCCFPTLIFAASMPYGNSEECWEYGEYKRPFNGALEFLDGYTIRVSCEMGYEVQGSEMVFCDDGYWSTKGQGDFPTCERRKEYAETTGCKPLRINEIQNAKVKYNKASVSCNPSYSLEGSSKIFCEDGDWSSNGDFPACLSEEDTEYDNEGREREPRK